MFRKPCTLIYGPVHGQEFTILNLRNMNIFNLHAHLCTCKCVCVCVCVCVFVCISVPTCARTRLTCLHERCCEAQGQTENTGQHGNSLARPRAIYSFAHLGAMCTQNSHTSPVCRFVVRKTQTKSSVVVVACVDDARVCINCTRAGSGEEEGREGGKEWRRRGHRHGPCDRQGVEESQQSLPWCS